MPQYFRRHRKRRNASPRRHLGVFLLLAGALLATFAGVFRFFFKPLSSRPGEETTTSRLEQFGAAVDKRLMPVWKAARVPYPPTHLLFVAYKHERRLDVYSLASDSNSIGGDASRGATAPNESAQSLPSSSPPPLRAFAPGITRHFIKSYPILGASGVFGPKLREGDGQVPEGFYGIEYLNPNSSFHLSMKVAYPNADDREQAAKEGRTMLGGDIMIHGNTGSRGCLAMGDPAVEELFVLVARAGVKNVEVLISPVDFRQEAAEGLPKKFTEISFPEWVAALHTRLREAVLRL